MICIAPHRFALGSTEEASLQGTEQLRQEMIQCWPMSDSREEMDWGFVVQNREDRRARRSGDTAVDRGGGVRLISQGGIPERGRSPTTATNVYVYLTYYNVVNRELVMRDGFHSIDEWQDKSTGRGKVYSNGGSEIYR